MKCLAACLLLLPLQAQAACNDQATQTDMNICAGQQAAKADAELNRVFKQVLAKRQADANATAKLRAAERAWVAYRDAYIEAMFPAADKQAEYGSIYPLEAAGAQTKLTQQQTQNLQALLSIGP